MKGAVFHATWIEERGSNAAVASLKFYNDFAILNKYKY